MAEATVVPIPYSYWVEPGRLLAGQYPGALDPDAAAHKVRKLLAAGIDLFLDLTTGDDGLESYAFILAREAGALGSPARRVAMPVRDLSVPTAAGMKQILDTIDAGLAAGHNIYAHCWGGIGRTGTVIGCYLVRHGLSGPEALAELTRLRQGWPDRRSAPETEEQRRMVRGWPVGG